MPTSAITCTRCRRDRHTPAPPPPTPSTFRASSDTLTHILRPCYSEPVSTAALSVTAGTHWLTDGVHWQHQNTMVRPRRSKLTTPALTGNLPTCHTPNFLSLSLSHTHTHTHTHSRARAHTHTHTGVYTQTHARARTHNLVHILCHKLYSFSHTRASNTLIVLYHTVFVSFSAQREGAGGGGGERERVN